MQSNISKIFNLNVVNGRSVYDKNLIREFMGSLKNGYYQIIIRRKRSKRSLPQNSLYWVSYVTPLADHLGYTSEEMHAIYKYMILRKRFGFESTTELSKSEFSEYLEFIRIFAQTEHNFIIDEDVELNNQFDFVG